MQALEPSSPALADDTAVLAVQELHPLPPADTGPIGPLLASNTSSMEDDLDTAILTRAALQLSAAVGVLQACFWST
eukprot:SM000021S06489  [mRNA]  locus=s21:634757:634984:+ [translate_table: standard]